jgi:hypothetical protein
MKTTKYLIAFTALNTLSTVAFFVCIDKGIGITKVTNEPNTYVTSLPFIYGLIWFISSGVFGKLDSVRKTRMNLGLAYHMASNIAMAIGMVFAVITLKELRTWQFIVFPTLAMGVSYLVHWFFVRKTVKGIEIEKAFK